jgi:hypothetical protein
MKSEKKNTFLPVFVKVLTVLIITNKVMCNCVTAGSAYTTACIAHYIVMHVCRSFFSSMLMHAHVYLLLGLNH